MQPYQGLEDNSMNLFNAKAKTLFIAGLMTTLILGGSLAQREHAAVAQAQNSTSRQKAPTTRKIQNKDLPENRAEQLNDLADTPGIPKYNGKYVFVQGVVFPSAQSGPSMTMKFNAREKPQAILDWYKDSFKQNNWDIEKCTTDEKIRVGATKDKNICRVMVQPSPDPLFPSRVVLTYRLYRGSK